MSPEPAAKSRLTGQGATRVITAEPIRGTRESLGAQQTGTELGTAFGTGIAVTNDSGPAVGSAANWLAPSRHVINATTVRSEYAPGVMYVRGRLLQMRDRSQFELQPYPDESLIANAWFYASRLVAPGCPTPSVVPSEDGNVSFVWHKGGWDIEVEVGWQDAEVWAEQVSDGETLNGSFRDTGHQLKALLHRLT